MENSDLPLGREDFIIHDMDDMLDEISARLIVSTMVSDTVIRDKVKEVAKMMASKEAEVASLKERLHLYEAGMAHGGSKFSEWIDGFAEEQLQRLQKGIKEIKCSSLFNGVNSELERISNKLVEMDESIGNLKAILEARNKKMSAEEMKSREKKDLLFCELNKNWLVKVDKLTSLRHELDSIFSSESGHLSSYGSHESLEDLSFSKRRDVFHRKAHLMAFGNHHDGNGTSEKHDETKITALDESAHLKHMTKEDLISHFKKEISEMKRNHESQIHEITEEYFSLWRDYTKERNSSPFKKDKESELMKKKIAEVVSKFDDILIESKKLPVALETFEDVLTLKNRNDILVHENQKLMELLANERKVVESLSSRVSDAVNQMQCQSVAEVSLEKQIEKQKCVVEDLKLEDLIREDIYQFVLSHAINGQRCELDDLVIETLVMQDIYNVIVSNTVIGAEETINLLVMEHDREKNRHEAILLENEQALASEIKEKEELRQELSSLSLLLQEKDRLSSEAMSEWNQLKVAYDLVCEELNMLRDQAGIQEKLMMKKQEELEMISGDLNEALEKVQQYKVEMSRKDQKLEAALNVFKEADKQRTDMETVLNDLKEADKQRSEMEAVIEEYQNTISAAIVKEHEQGKQIKSLTNCVQGFAMTIMDMESSITKKIVQNDSRLENLTYQCQPLVKRADLLKKKALLYKQRFDRKCSDHEKAEYEVDVLGDEVDALLSVLEKVYIALDHYSHVLQHYPGIMEILKLVRRELRGETARPV
ncbi:hypothetical protein QJS10_CPA01g00560 [Acorus calamus]|uniref:WPP domain-associated protein n=1 Tax=Acorus calamus TaxID=4465 RepID=A0AAV9FJI1_ACOCL|nr:hypothetical protein QJS10_CPA01g00560 [Acorus calamus]